MTVPKVLVVGGGIAGPAFASWMARIGANVTLIERSAQARVAGQQVDLRGQGINAMEKLGIGEAVRAAVVHESGFQLIDRNGRTKAFFPAAGTGGEKQGFTSDYEIMRGDMVRILYKLTENRSNVKHLFNTTVQSFTQDDESDPNGKVHVHFHDGREEDFDLVVGADGTGSKTRRLMLSPDAPDPRRNQGGYIGFYSIPPKSGDSDRATFCHLPGSRMGRIIGTRKDCPEVTRVLMLMRGNDAALDAALKSGDLAATKKALSDIYEDDGWECRRFTEALRNAPEADDLYITPTQEVHLPKDSWSKGRIVLIGDAAHSATADGQGTSWGLIGAYILAGEIATRLAKKDVSLTAAVTEGARNYADIFHPIATAGHGGSAFFEDLMVPRSSLGIFILHSLAQVMGMLNLDKLAGALGGSSKWEIPDYPALHAEKENT
ncbi:hypothetical protein F5Y15DRAFT_242414 [Xylariaceae sp. FL0016]|nr:hypothetical protein F5Y15DRAFT_242414 [Xylariaceae sp. FL0016]